MDDEKRKFLRFECLVPVDLFEIGGGEGAVPGAAIIEDISREGIRMVLDVSTDLSPGAEFDFKIHNSEEPETCSVTGEIIWSKSKDNRLEVGIKLRKMDDSIKAKLLDIGYAKWLESRVAEEKKKTP